MPSVIINNAIRAVRREGQKCLRQQSLAFSTNTSLRMVKRARASSTILVASQQQQWRQSTQNWSISRSFTNTTTSRHGHWTPPKPGEEVYVTFIEKDGTEVKLAVSVGDNLLEIAQEHDIEMEGACEGSCSCSTCHVIVQGDEMFDRLDEASDEENDMLDVAFGLTETSRLGCQIKMTKELDGIVVKLPAKTRNMQASDFNS